MTQPDVTLRTVHMRTTKSSTLHPHEALHFVAFMASTLPPVRPQISPKTRPRNKYKPQQLLALLMQDSQLQSTLLPSDWYTLAASLSALRNETKDKKEIIAAVRMVVGRENLRRVLGG